MSNQRDEEFDSIYASIDDDDDDVEEMYVDVSSTPPNEGLSGPSPYVYPHAPQPPSPSVRKLPPLPVKPTPGVASKPPWPRRAPHPPPNTPSIKIYAPKKKASEPDRNVPHPLPRIGSMKKKDASAGKPPVKLRQAQPQLHQSDAKMAYHPPPPVIVNSGGRLDPMHQQYDPRDQGSTRGHQVSDFPPENEEPRYRIEFNRNQPSSQMKQQSLHKPPPPDAPPPPPRRQEQLLNTPTTDESDYESLRPARQRLLRGFGQQSRKSRRYSDSHVPLQDMASTHEDSMCDNGYQPQKDGGKREGVQHNSRIVCILLTIIVIALLISLTSLIMSLYTLTRFELSQRVNNSLSECDITVDNCSTVTESSDLDCQRGDDNVTHCSLGSGEPVHCSIVETECH